MRTDHDLERAVRAWVAVGSEQLPEPALDAALDEITRTNQRHAGWLARRIHLMNGNALKIGLAAAAIIAVAVLGLRFLPGTVGGPPDSTPTPVPTAETLASGSFAANLGEAGEAFGIEATRTGEDVSGTFERPALQAPTRSTAMYANHRRRPALDRRRGDRVHERHRLSGGVRRGHVHH